MRIMGIDYGDMRIGIAISDELKWTAQGIETIKRKDSLSQTIQRICDLVNQYSVSKIVVGLPKNMDGTLGETAQRVMNFINHLKKKIRNIEIITWDERLSTVSATRAMIEMDVKRSKKRTIVDKIAAMYILQSYLDFLGNTKI